MGALLGSNKIEMKTPLQSLIHKWREIFRRRPRMHDPMLVFNMSIFNFAGEWNRTFSQLKIHENDT
jgi:hypothetical protein